jgi:hypothetical protein
LKLFNRLFVFIRKSSSQIKLPHSLLKIFGVVTVKTIPGTLVIFDPRIVHAGGHLTGEQPKLSIFLSFAVPNVCSDQYLAWLQTHTGYVGERT